MKRYIKIFFKVISYTCACNILSQHSSASLSLLRTPVLNCNQDVVVNNFRVLPLEILTVF